MLNICPVQYNIEVNIYTIYMLTMCVYIYMFHVWNIYIHLPTRNYPNVGWYTKGRISGYTVNFFGHASKIERKFTSNRMGPPMVQQYLKLLWRCLNWRCSPFIEKNRWRRLLQLLLLMFFLISPNSKLQTKTVLWKVLTAFATAH